MAKALVGGMSLLLAEQDGRLKVDDLAWKYIPEWKNDPVKSQITIRHLATHTSGIEDSEISEQDKVSAMARGIEINRSEEHTSELQSLMRISYAVFCLKKKN